MILCRFKPSMLAWLVLLCSSRAACAGDAIDGYIEQQLHSAGIPGVALLVMQGGRVVKEQGYGFANLEHQVRVTPDTLFQSGSTGKMFTAVAVLRLADDGALRLDDPLSAYYPDAPSAWHRITIRQLLTHTSGIKDYAEINSGDLDYRKDYTDDELLAAMQKLPLDFEPGAQWSYSNSGYVILGLLVSKLAGKDYSEFLAERLFRPLGMPTIQLISERRITPNRAAGYERDEKGVLGNQAWVAPGLNRTADGSLYYSLRDLEAWERALDAGKFMRADDFVSWWTPVRLNDGTRFPYGFGWHLAEQRGERVIEHGGSWQGFKAAIVRYPDQQLAVLVMANAAHADAGRIASTVAGLVEPRLAERPSGEAGGSTDPERAARLLDVLEAWGHYRTSPAMAPALARRSTGSAVEAHGRQHIATLLRTARSLRLLGSDELSKAAVTAMSDGTVRSTDALLEGPGGDTRLRFRLDGAGRVLDFQVVGP